MAALTIDGYIAQFPEELQVILRDVRAAIRENAPDATEKISYGMQCYWQGTDLIYFAAMKNHLGRNHTIPCIRSEGKKAITRREAGQPYAVVYIIGKIFSRL